MSPLKKMKLAIGLAAPLLIVGALFWYTFLTPLAICAEKGGIYVKESLSCVCSSNEGLFVCFGEESESTAALIEKIYKRQTLED
jgi:hypothetical protein